MRKAISFLLVVTFVVSLGIVASANTPVVNRRERRQQNRIYHGINNGELTRREAARLEREQFAIHAYERRAKSDGNVSWRERYRLDNMQDRANRSIRRQTHDRQDR